MIPTGNENILFDLNRPEARPRLSIEYTDGWRVPQCNAHREQPGCIRTSCFTQLCR
jgi:hypothetical protein